MRWMVLALVVPLLAGCSDEPVEAQAEAVVQGTLEGVVVDATVTPIEGALVVVQPGGQEATTDADGRFVFDALEPGTYALTASKDGFLSTTAVASVLADRESPVARLALDANPEAAKYASTYQFQGYFECGGGIDDITCSNVNIVTWIILGLGNVTSDRSLWLQWIGGPPTALQTELVWDSTQPLGDRLGFAVGGATEEQLATGMATTHNYTFGASSLMLRIPQPELAESGIGVDRALLTQVVPAPYQDVPGGCVVYDPCGPGLQLLQPFETFTNAFYGYAPPVDWRFVDDGPLTPP